MLDVQGLPGAQHSPSHPTSLVIFMELQCSSSPQAGLTHAQAEVVEGMSVDAVQLAHQGDAVLHHDPDVSVLSLLVLRHSGHGLTIKSQHRRLFQTAAISEFSTCF